MSHRPWMALYVADYLADTEHLNAAESGAYLHLIMHYWRRGGLPADDGRLSRIAKMTPDEWCAARPLVQAFFTDGWKHGRIEFELTEAARILAQTKAAGKASGALRQKRYRERKTASRVTPETNGRSSMIAQQHQVLAEASPTQHANGRPTERQRLPSPSRPMKDARARARSDNSILKEGKEAGGGPVRIQLDTPEWIAWQAHLRKTTGAGSPQDKAFGWNFPSRWPPGHEASTAAPAKPPAKPLQPKLPAKDTAPWEGDGKHAERVAADIAARRQRQEQAQPEERQECHT